MPSALRSPPSLFRFYATAAIFVSLDLWAKAAAFSHLSFPGEPYRFIPGWLEFEAVENHGAVFGLGQGGRVIFIIVSIAAIIFLNYLFAQSQKRWVYQLLLGLLLAGVIGNLYDRIVFGYVRDLIHALPRWPNFFPWVFNIADSCLCVGVSLMILYSLVTEHARKKEQAPHG
jgi:signal peptidase II